MSQPTTPGQPNQPQPGNPGGYPPAGQQPPQQYPPQPGYPAQQPAAQQPGYAPPPPPQAYPQQPGYPPQQAYPQQGYAAGGYQPAQGYSPQGFTPGGGQRPPAGKSSNKLIMIVLGVVALLAIAGGVFLAMSGNRTPDGPEVTPSPVPSTPTTPVESPTPAPTTSEPTEPTPAPTTQPPTTPAPNPGDSTTIDLGGGVVLAVAPGWQISQQAANGAVVTNGKAVFLAETAQGKPEMDPGQLCTSYQAEIMKGAPNLQSGEARPQDAGTSKVALADCVSAYTQTQGGKTVQMYAQSFASVRTSDGFVVFATVFYDESTPDATIGDVNAMLNALIGSQVQGG